MIRRVAVVLFACLALAPTSALAAPKSPPVSIDQCLKAQKPSATGMTLREARACAPSAKVVDKPTGNGTFIVKTDHGYAIAASQSVATPAALTGGAATADTATYTYHCYWRTYWIVSAAILWVGATMCYVPYWDTWVSGSVSTSCHQYVPSGWCNYYYGWSSYHGYFTTAGGTFHQTAGWIFDVCDVVYIDQWWDGSWNGDWYGC